MGSSLSSSLHSGPGAASSEAGGLLGQYRIVRSLGFGGMGHVYQVRHARTEKLYALKTLRADRRSRANSFVRFQREAHLLARLNHENIVQLHDLYLEESLCPYLVMEYIEGRTLREELSQEGVRPRQLVLEVLAQLCRGLVEAHRAGIVHRDLKPENIMLTSHADGRILVKILDFGVARLYQDQNWPLTNTDVGVGTAAYMSPEQARGERNLDARSDIHALGAIAYEMLTGRPLFVGSSYNEILFQVANRQHKPLAERRPDLSACVVDLVETALAKERTGRFESAAEMLSLMSRGEAFPVEQRSVAAGGIVQPVSEPSARSVGNSRYDETINDADVTADELDPVLEFPSDNAPSSASEVRPSPSKARVRLIGVGVACLGLGALVGYRLRLPHTSTSLDDSVPPLIETQLSASQPPTDTQIEHDTPALRSSQSQSFEFEPKGFDPKGRSSQLPSQIDHSDKSTSTSDRVTAPKIQSRPVGYVARDATRTTSKKGDDETLRALSDKRDRKPRFSDAPHGVPTKRPPPTRLEGRYIRDNPYRDSDH